MMYARFPCDGGPAYAVADVPFPNVAREFKNLACIEGQSGVVKGTRRSDWGMWVTCWFKENFALGPGDTPNPYFADQVRGDIYVFVNLETEDGAVAVDVPPLSVSSAEDLGAQLRLVGEQCKQRRVQARALKDAGIHGGRAVPASHMLEVTRAAGGEPPAPVKVAAESALGRLVSRVFADDPTEIEQAGWVVHMDPDV